MAKAIEVREYSEVVREFVSIGAALIRSSIQERYHGLVADHSRPLEPGYIPPGREARVLIVSYYPNASSVPMPAGKHDEQIANFAAWGTSGTVAAYCACYRDWLTALNYIPFHKTKTKPILDIVGLKDEDIAWLPLVKAPMKAGSSPGDDIVDIDRDVTWKQIQILRPRIVWIQGFGVEDCVKGLVKERITDQILPTQSLTSYMSAAKRDEERARISRRLSEYLSEIDA
jgi:hypothetical protein